MLSIQQKNQDEKGSESWKDSISEINLIIEFQNIYSDESRIKSSQICQVMFLLSIKHA